VLKNHFTPEIIDFSGEAERLKRQNYLLLLLKPQAIHYVKMNKDSISEWSK
jgi:hypothetical protein